MSWIYFNGEDYLNCTMWVMLSCGHPMFMDVLSPFRHTSANQTVSGCIAGSYHFYIETLFAQI